MSCGKTNTNITGVFECEIISGDDICYLDDNCVAWRCGISLSTPPSAIGVRRWAWNPSTSRAHNSGACDMYSQGDASSGSLRGPRIVMDSFQTGRSRRLSGRRDAPESTCSGTASAGLLNGTSKSCKALLGNGIEQCCRSGLVASRGFEDQGLDSPAEVSRGKTHPPDSPCPRP